MTSLVSSFPPASPHLPRHIAIIMDGNGRWAQARGLARWEGHSQGARAVRETVELARAQGIRYLTLYAFSVNNWKRPRLEVEALMRLLSHFAKREQADLIRQGIRVRVAGRLQDLPAGVRKSLQNLLTATEHCEKMTLTLALSYGARSDLLQSVQELARQAASGALHPEEIDEDALLSHMSTSHLPPVDLLIRTGGESRLSDFLLVESAYAELSFLPVLWPDFTQEQFLAALDRYQNVERRFGLTSEQVSPQKLSLRSQAG